MRKHLRLLVIDGVEAIELAVTEAVANGALHAYPPDEPGKVDILIRPDKESWKWWYVTRDSGCDRTRIVGAAITESC